MSKKVKWTLGICVLIICIVSIGIWSFLRAGTIQLSSGQSVVIRWEDEEATLSQTEADKVISLLNAQQYELFLAVGGCPYNERLAVTVGDTTFHIAQDDCMSLKNPDRHQYPYIVMSKKDWTVLADIFAKYDCHYLS